MGCDRKLLTSLLIQICFNPRTRMGCDKMPCSLASKSKQFQSTHPHGVRQEGKQGKGTQRGVSIHAPAWGATFVMSVPGKLKPFQSTHPHGVRRENSTASKSVYPFQSTHPHGVRRGKQGRIIEVHEFQSTHPHGVRHSSQFEQKTSATVSIHAPAWGATLTNRIVEILRLFQSTHPHGVRPENHDFFGIQKRCFNPRTRMGCDDMQAKQLAWEQVSIHAPAWGATARNL